MRSVSVRWVAIGVAVIAAAVLVAQAAALTISTAAITFPNVTLNGASQTVLDDSTSAWRADAVGENGGWNVTVSSTDFNGSGKTIAVSNFEIRLLDTDIVWVSGGTKPTSTQTTFAALS